MVDESVTLRVAEREDAAALLGVIREAFGARPPVDPPAEALSDDVASIEQALTGGIGVVAESGGRIVAGLLVAFSGGVATLRRVSVSPGHTQRGLARDVVAAAAMIAAQRGVRRLELFAREEFPQLIQWWRDNGFEVVAAEPHGVRMGRDLPVAVEAATAGDMRCLGRRIAGLLRAGDVIVASGGLGAGKTTLTQGIGAGLGVEGPIISPTFVLSRVHPNPSGGPGLVHVDAYRLGDPAELADIDLDASLAGNVTLIEWGSGLAEWLSESRLEIEIVRELDDDIRTVYLTGVGPRWAGALDALRRPL